MTNWKFQVVKFILLLIYKLYGCSDLSHLFVVVLSKQKMISGRTSSFLCMQTWIIWKQFLLFQLCKLALNGFKFELILNLPILMQILWCVLFVLWKNKLERSLKSNFPLGKSGVFNAFFSDFYFQYGRSSHPQ